MRVLEQFIEGKNKDQNVCEDGTFISSDFLVVIDGVTAKSDVKYEGKALGRAAMEKVKVSLSSMPKNFNAKQAISKITSDIANWYKELELYNHLRENSVERPAASLVIYSVYRKELWMVGDCQALVDDEHINNDKEIDRIMAEARACFINAELAQGKTEKELLDNDTSRGFILPMLKKQSIFQNNPNYNCEYSFGVIDGFNVHSDEIKVIDVSGAKKIVLASDGYPKLFGTLKKTEEYLAYIMKEDPLCYKINKVAKGLVKGNSSFDDRSYLSFEI